MIPIPLSKLNDPKLNESVRRLLCDQIYEWLDGDTVEERKE